MLKQRKNIDGLQENTDHITCSSTGNSVHSWPTACLDLLSDLRGPEDRIMDDYRDCVFPCSYCTRKQTHTDRQTDRQTETDKQTNKQTDTQTHRESRRAAIPWTSSTPKKSEVPVEPTLYMMSASCSLVVTWNWTEVLDDPDCLHTPPVSWTTESALVNTTGRIVVESAQSENVGAPCVSTKARRWARSIRSRWMLSARYITCTVRQLQTSGQRTVCLQLKQYEDLFATKHRICVTIAV